MKLQSRTLLYFMKKIFFAIALFALVGSFVGCGSMDCGCHGCKGCCKCEKCDCPECK